MDPTEGRKTIMIKKQSKWISLLVALTFVWMLQISSLPLGAAGDTEQIGSASSEQGPGYTEAIGHKAAPAAKKSILPWILIGVGAVAVTAVLILVVFKTKYDITGDWTFLFTGPYSANVRYTFIGTRSSGSFTSPDSYPGTYVVDGKNVTFTVTGSPDVVFTGTFTGKDTITGTWVEGGLTWNFTGTRTAASTGVKAPSSFPIGSRGPLAANR
jgi:hypothetical protein